MRTIRFGVVGALTGLLTLAPVIAEAASVTPELISGSKNHTCSEFAPAGTTWIELKADPNADGVYSDGTLSVTISNTTGDKTFDWSSNIGVDAVFVKAGSAGSYLYRYDEATGDTGLTSPGAGETNQISHISFCYDAAGPQSSPTPTPTQPTTGSTASPATTVRGVKIPATGGEEAWPAAVLGAMMLAGGGVLLRATRKTA